jgi:glycosyltransferase involved in cell wall biosynthesis
MNGTRHLAETLRSILGQEGVAFELLICDDRSEDDTLAQVRTLAGVRARVIENSERLGLAGNWNACAARSQTPFVAIVHQDDVLRPGHLAAHVSAFERDGSVGLVASASSVVDDSGKPVADSVVGRGGLGPTDRTFAPGEALAALALGNPLRCSAVSLRVAAHAAVGGFNPGLRYVVDWDLWARVATSWSLAWLARETVDVRWHSASETHRFKTGTADLEESERVLSGLLDLLRERSDSVAAIATVAHQRLARGYLNRAYELLKAGDGPRARECLRRSLSLAPTVIRALVADPRLAIQMAALYAAPVSSARWFSRPG